MRILIWFLTSLILIPRVMWANLAYLAIDLSSEEDSPPTVLLSSIPKKKKKVAKTKAAIHISQISPPLKTSEVSMFNSENCAMSQNVVVLIFTDGRKECFSSTFQSFKENVTAKKINHKIIIDDSNDPDYAFWLDTNYQHEVDYIEHHGKRLGFGGTIRDTWQNLDKISGTYDYIFHLEDDFIFNRPVNLDDLILILKKNPSMAQVSLLRQPWNQNEIDAGGVWQQWPDHFIEESINGPNGKLHYLNHKEWFSTNPSVYPKWVASLGWPEGSDSEGRFWDEKLLTRNLLSCSCFGSKTDPPAVTHIGAVQVGTGY